VAQEHVLFHTGSPQVEIAVFQAQVFIDLDFFVDVKGRRIGSIEYLGILNDYLDVTGGYFGVLGARRTLSYLTGNPNDVLVTHLFGGFQA